MTIIVYTFPLLSLASLLIAFVKKQMNYALISLWISVIAVAVNYQLAGGEIFSPYFGVSQAIPYSANIVVFMISTVFMLYCIKDFLLKKRQRFFIDGLAVFLIAGVIIILINLWTNAWFIESRFPKTPLMEVATFNKPFQCEHAFVILKINKKAKIKYLCPNDKGIFAAIKTYDKPIPEFISDKIPSSILKELQQENPQWKKVT